MPISYDQHNVGPSDGKTTRLAWGVQMKCSGDYLQKRILEQGEWEPHVTKVFFDVVKEGSLVIDVGANIGYFSLLASKLVGPKGRVIAFEPSYRSFQHLFEHITINKCRNVISLNLALGDAVKGIELGQPSAGNEGAGTLRPVSDVADASKEVVITTLLDNILPPELWAEVSLVKVDTEGWDYFCLQGMERRLAVHRPVILTEINLSFYEDLAVLLNDGRGSKELVEGFYDFITTRGYTVYAHATEAHPAGAGWVAVSGIEDFFLRLSGPQNPWGDLDLCLVPEGTRVDSVQQRQVIE